MREIFEYSIRLSTIIPDKVEIASHIGQEFVGHADELMAQLSAIEAKGAFTIIRKEESDFIFGRQIAPIFARAEKIALFVATLGEESKEIIASKKTDILEYYLVDFLASQFAEGAAQYMHDMIKEYANKSLLLYSNRYSPGYCGWNVKEQIKLFGFFSENQCGIRLTDSCLMDPVKSVSGAVALGNVVKYQEYGCKKCGEKNCLYKSKF
ncbi:MAG: vitamin B12 dependent-methionine synthase activation domain-containing protein [Bacteroidales bacterium]|jgi:cobalamin-dependent methionine synthase I